MAEAALERELYSPCVFHCQQALEKVLKAMWIGKAPEGVPPRRHNLVELAEEVGLQLSPEQLSFLSDLSRQYMPSRYGDVAVEYSRQEAENYHRKTRELFPWLRQQLS
ncbi:MAG: HEPN domain-containing protein [Dehalococcoidia bacterium]